MADDSKLTELTANTAPVATDLTYLVDDPGGSPLSQKITLQTLLEFFKAPYLIDSETTSSSATSVTLNFEGGAIPATWNHLKIVWVARSTTTATKTLRIRFNADTNANYDRESLQASDTATAVTEENGATSGLVGIFTASDALAGAPGSGSIEIPFYANTTFHKDAHALHGRTDSTGVTVTGICHTGWRSTAAITSVTLFPSADAFLDGSKFYLYGVY